MAYITANGAKGHHKFTLTISETSTSTASNTSTLSYTFTLSPIQTGWDWASWGSKISYSFSINGTKYDGTIPNYDGKSTVTLKSGTQTVAHDADGTKTISYSFSVTDGAGKSYTPGKASASGTMALTTIPRAATLLTAPNFSDGQNPTITYSNSAGNAVTSLQAAIYNADGSMSYVPYEDIPKTESSYTFNLSAAQKETLRKATKEGNTLPIRFYIRTVIGGATYLSTPLERTFSITDANPIITASVVDIHRGAISLTGDEHKLIRYYSIAEARMSATAQKGATIDANSYIIRNGSNTADGNLCTFENVESNEFAFYAKDSRGNPGSAFLTPTMIDYIKPTCIISNNKPDADGDMVVSCSGNFFNGSFGAATNDITVAYRYKVYGGSYSSWTGMASVTKNGNWYTASASLTGLDYQKTYVFQTRVTDTISQTQSVEWTTKSMPGFHWGANDFVFEVPVTFKQGTTGATAENNDTHEGDFHITGNLRLKGDGNYGNALLFGDGVNCYISEPENNVLYVKAKRIDFDTNAAYFYGNDEPLPVVEKGIWTPSLNTAAVSSYSTQYGWYSKVGQTVSAGFYIKANCISGYDNMGITIYGLPFTPLHPAAGGGMCSGAYVNSGWNFQCFVAGTDGYITTRVQNCNNTTAANLSTSASGCFYRSGGGEMTLSGTITFMSNS